MTERENIRQRKEMGLPKPWSSDPVFQNTYFCNVHREHDKVTKYIRRMYNPHYADNKFVMNLVFARFINWPQTLEKIGYLHTLDRDALRKSLTELSNEGKIWGGAYIITTHGQRMGKIDYLVDQVLPDVEKLTIPMHHHMGCDIAHKALMTVDGLGSFLAAQIVADMKNTPFCWLGMADDWSTFVAPGPGSIRGASWFFYGHTTGVTAATFGRHFAEIRKYVDANFDGELCNQDLQNCLCEFDKYMRVKTGTGRSKRGYNGRR